MREHLISGGAALGAGDRAALQSLIPLAGGLGAGTIFGLFFVGRRRAGFAVFEAIAIVAVLVCVAATSYYAIALLHRDDPIANKELVETAVPLVIAAVLRILITPPHHDPPRRPDGLFDVTDWSSDPHVRSFTP